MGTARPTFACSTQRGGRPRTTDIRAVINAIFYLLRTGCQWRLLPREFPAWGTVYHYFRMWKNSGVWTCLQREIYEQTRRKAGRSACPSVVIMDGQSVKTTERGGARGFDAHKRVKGRKRHILVDTLGLPIACRVEPANISDRRAASLLLGGLPAGTHVDEDDVLTISQIAALLKCSKNHVSKILNGKVPGVAILAHFVMGRRKLSRRRWLTDWMEANKKQC